MSREILLGDGPITPADLAEIAAGTPIALAPNSLARMGEGRAVLMRSVAENAPIYGVTTGLGPRVVDRLDKATQQAFPAATVRGRAHAVGVPLAPGIVRAAMAARVQSLLTGATGARPEVASHIAACLNAGLIPVVGETASIGAGDLMWGGMIGLGMIGEGQMDTSEGRRNAADALASAGIEPLDLASREGLVFVSNSAPTGAIAALALAGFAKLFRSAQAAAALSLEGFRANLSPLDPGITGISPKPGQDVAATALLAWLEGSGLHTRGAARRLQDPLSLRNIVQVHGAVVAAMDFLEPAVMAEINHPTDNPIVLIDRGEILSGGAYLSPQLAISLQAMNDATRHLAAQSVSRIAKQLSNRFSDLPPGLSSLGVGGVGFGAMMKVVETLFAEIAHLAQPAPVYPSPSADGVEDTVTHAAIPAKALLSITDKLRYLVAIELMVATQSVELRAVAPAPALVTLMARVREVVAPLGDDRSLTAEIECLAERLAGGMTDGIAD